MHSHIQCSWRLSVLFALQGASCGVGVGVAVVDAVHFLFCDYVKRSIVRSVAGVRNWGEEECMKLTIGLLDHYLFSWCSLLITQYTKTYCLYSIEKKKHATFLSLQ